METVNVMAKISNGSGGVGSVRSQRRRLVSEPSESLVSFRLHDINLLSIYQMNSPNLL